jgi:hypothetical protein
MTVGGWIIMILSVGSVSSLLIWTIVRVINIPGATEHIHSELDIDTRDQDT